jgi:hypothetical protein
LANLARRFLPCSAIAPDSHLAQANGRPAKIARRGILPQTIRAIVSNDVLRRRTLRIPLIRLHSRPPYGPSSCSGSALSIREESNIVALACTGKRIFIGFRSADAETFGTTEAPSSCKKSLPAIHPPSMHRVSGRCGQSRARRRR